MKQNSAKSSCLAAENKINPLYQRKWFVPLLKQGKEFYSLPCFIIFLFIVFFCNSVKYKIKNFFQTFFMVMNKRLKIIF